jgi:transposase
MITLAPGLRVYLVCGTTDMRKGMVGLAMLVQQTLGVDHFDGAAFAFRGRRAGLIKLIWHDGVGLCMLSKRLERGQFAWPSTQTTGRIALSSAQLVALLDGCEWRAPVIRRPALCRIRFAVGRNKFWQRHEPVVHHSLMLSDGDGLPDDPIILQRMLQELMAENDKLRLLIQRFTRHQFGRRSEQLTADQLQFGLEDQEQSIAEHQTARGAAEAAGGRQSSPQTRRPLRNRRRPAPDRFHPPRSDPI